MMPCRALTGTTLVAALATLALAAGCGGDGLRRLAFSSGGAPRSALLVPAPAPGPAPLLVAFHGLGGSADGLVAALGDAPGRSGAHLVAPDALPCAPLGGVPCWPAEGDAPPEAERAELSAFDDLVARAGDEVGVDPERIYVLGLSNGGGWAVRLVLDRARTVRGALVLAGYDPGQPYAREPGGIALPLRPTGPSETRAPAVRRPVMLVHGADDATVPAARARELRRTLLALGWEPEAVSLELIPGGGHDAPELLAPEATRRRLERLLARA